MAAALNVIDSEFPEAQLDFRQVVNLAEDALIVVDPMDGRLKYANTASEALFGYSASEMKCLRIEDLIPERHRANHDAFVRRFVEGAHIARGMAERAIISALAKDGEEVPVFASLCKLNGEVSAPSVAVWFRDASNELKIREGLRRLSEIDPMSGLPNRGAFDRHLKGLLGRIKPSGTTFSVILMDIDHFKQVNDRYGHMVGDMVIKQVGIETQAIMRASDLVARIGGEEYGLLLPGTDGTGAKEAAEKVRLAVSELTFAPDGPARITVSAGVATATSEDSVCDLVLRADKTLYEAKRSGRDRVVASAHQGRRDSTER
jgi:diguanylate cyclase (GGDEF)-like protein/PAS domain S-box-containing protein